MYISDGMKYAMKWMHENDVVGDPEKLKLPSIGRLLTIFADDYRYELKHELTKKNKNYESSKRDGA